MVKSDILKGSEIVRNSGSGEPQKRKRKTWLWVIGWIFAFPIPLTILMIRNQKLNKILKIIIIAVAWLFYLLIVSSFGGNSKDVTETTSNIKKLEFTNTKDITVKVGQSDSNGYLKVSVNKKKEFVPEDVVFVSDNTLYLDKNLIWHTLVQAYSRTNRVDKVTKQFGQIITFRNIKRWQCKIRKHSCSSSDADQG